MKKYYHAGKGSDSDVALPPLSPRVCRHGDPQRAPQSSRTGPQQTEKSLQPETAMFTAFRTHHWKIVFYGRF